MNQVSDAATADTTTAANGLASFTPTAGSNKSWAGNRNPSYSAFSDDALPGFEAR